MREKHVITGVTFGFYMKDTPEQFTALWGYLKRLQDALQVEPISIRAVCFWSWLANLWEKKGVRNPRAPPASQWASCLTYRLWVKSSLDCMSQSALIKQQAVVTEFGLWEFSSRQWSELICLPWFAWLEALPPYPASRVDGLTYPGTKLAHWIPCPLLCWLAAYHHTLAHTTWRFTVGVNHRGHGIQVLHLNVVQNSAIKQLLNWKVEKTQLQLTLLPFWRTFSQAEFRSAQFIFLLQTAN